MKPSTAAFIPYNLRPTKQAERRILLDFLKCANEVGLSVSDCRYVGMGGTAFYDFHLMHRFLGINRMVSLERDPNIFPRCEFNRPFDFINVQNKTVASFLAEDDELVPTIYWFDYDDGFGPDIIADIISLGTQVRLGGFAFVTVYADPPGVLQKLNKEERLEYFHENMGDFAVGLTADELDNSRFSEAVHRVLTASFQNAFATRTDGKFQALFQIRYKDSVPMLTVGGCFSTSADAHDILSRHSPDDIQIRGRRTTDPPPWELRTLRSPPMRRLWRADQVRNAIWQSIPPSRRTSPIVFTSPLISSAYAGTGLGRRSSIKLKIFWNKLLGTATSANWNVTYRP